MISVFTTDPGAMFGTIGAIGIIIVVAIYLAVFALGLWIQYLIIKTAVRHGLRDHTLWLEQRRGPLR